MAPTKWARNQIPMFDVSTVCLQVNTQVVGKRARHPVQREGEKEPPREVRQNVGVSVHRIVRRRTERGGAGGRGEKGEVKKANNKWGNKMGNIEEQQRRGLTGTNRVCKSACSAKCYGKASA